eukprot:2353213-Pyramimonas_sp.AAC.1
MGKINFFNEQGEKLLRRHPENNRHHEDTAVQYMNSILEEGLAFGCGGGVPRRASWSTRVEPVRAHVICDPYGSA